MLAALTPSSASRQILNGFHRMHASLAVPKGIRIFWMEWISIFVLRRGNLVLRNKVLECFHPGDHSVLCVIVHYSFLTLVAKRLESVLVSSVLQECLIVVLADFRLHTLLSRLVERGQPPGCLRVPFQPEIEASPRKDNVWIWLLLLFAGVIALCSPASSHLDL